MFKKILIANRGEIARRLILACRQLRIQSVVVYSDADADAPWVRLADESYGLGGVTAADSYLDQRKVLDAAARSGAEAVHPGYGFLSENPSFARACADRGLVFIGPGPAAMERLGSKAAARELAGEAGVPVVPGVDGAGKSDAELVSAARAIGFPVLVKASAGGGGKGMRVVSAAAEMADAVQAARREALSAFGDDHLLVERYMPEIHHVEIQILADHHGQVRHLFERECSIQRRHQKIVEESPAPVVADPALRRDMAAAAVSLAATAGYVNAGTVEFIVDGEGRFYFLEMNTRLQVEHPVTELVTGLDLAAWQIRVAAGERLPWTQADIRQQGHAIECRVYAEDPAHAFMPSTGRITLYRPPAGPGIRVDDGIETGSVVTPYYDPMLAKLITWGQDRAEAIARMDSALREMVILGVTTNIPYLLDIMREAQFKAGRTTTGYLTAHMGEWAPPVVTPGDQRETGDEEVLLAMAALELLAGHAPGTTPVSPGDSEMAPDPWRSLPGWRNV